jgi:acetylornithine deacetylase/succinyl-diaminopimelate desuccinylase-like protein
MQKHRFIADAQQIIAPFLADLKAVVNIDSGTHTKVGVDQVATYLEARIHDFGFDTRIDVQHPYGNNLVATHKGIWILFFLKERLYIVPLPSANAKGDALQLVLAFSI